MATLDKVIFGFSATDSKKTRNLRQREAELRQELKDVGAHIGAICEQRRARPRDNWHVVYYRTEIHVQQKELAKLEAELHCECDVSRKHDLEKELRARQINSNENELGRLLYGAQKRHCIVQELDDKAARRAARQAEMDDFQTVRHNTNNAGRRT